MPPTSSVVSGVHRVTTDYNALAIREAAFFKSPDDLRHMFYRETRDSADHLNNWYRSVGNLPTLKIVTEKRQNEESGPRSSTLVLLVWNTG